MVDTDNSGTLDIKEFKSFIAKVDSTIEANRVEDAFFENDGKSGELTVDQFTNSIKFLFQK